MERFGKFLNPIMLRGQNISAFLHRGYGFCRARAPDAELPTVLESKAWVQTPQGVRRAKHAATRVQNTFLMKTCHLTSASGAVRWAESCLCLKCGCEASMFVKGQLRAFWSLPQSYNNNKQIAQVGHLPMNPILTPSRGGRYHSEPFFRCEYRGTEQS